MGLGMPSVTLFHAVRHQDCNPFAFQRMCTVHLLPSLLLNHPDKQSVRGIALTRRPDRRPPTAAG